MKKLKYFILLLCLSIMLTGCTKKEEKEPTPKSTVTPLLLEVTKEGTDNKLYLFGSIHAAEKTMYPLPDYILNAYRKSDVIAVEFDLVEYSSNMENSINLLSKFVLPDGLKITDYIDEETYNSGVAILDNLGLYNSIYDYYNPMFWYSLMESAAIDELKLYESYGIDHHILERAKEDNKKILELESAEYQYNMLLGFDEEVQKYLLKQSIEEYEKGKNSLKQLYEYYKKGNREELETVLFEEEEPNQYEKDFNEQLLTVRNDNMVNSLEKALQDGDNIFCTVGLAHIIGENGIADQLEQKGYIVKEVR